MCRVVPLCLALGISVCLAVPASAAPILYTSLATFDAAVDIETAFAGFGPSRRLLYRQVVFGGVVVERPDCELMYQDVDLLVGNCIEVANIAGRNYLWTQYGQGNTVFSFGQTNTVSGFALIGAPSFGGSVLVTEGDGTETTIVLTPQSGEVPGLDFVGWTSDLGIASIRVLNTPSLWHIEGIYRSGFSNPGAALPDGIVESSLAPIAAPEPSSLLLVAVGACAAARHRRRIRRLAPVTGV